MIESISQSMLGMFLRCPAQFERRYIIGEIIPPGIAARRGSATHKAAQINHEQKLQSKEDMIVNDLQDVARDHYVKLIKEEGVFIPKETVGEKEKLLAEGLDAAVRLTKLYREELAPSIYPVLVEQKLSIDAGLDVPITGIIDVLTEDNDLEDMKTSDKSKPAGEAENSLQLTFYSGLVYHRTGKWPRKTNLRILVNNATPKLQTLESSRGPRDWERLIERIRFVLMQIRVGIFPPADPNSWSCTPKFCGYWFTCRWGAKR